MTNIQIILVAFIVHYLAMYLTVKSFLDKIVSRDTQQIKDMANKLLNESALADFLAEHKGKSQ